MNRRRLSRMAFALAVALAAAPASLAEETEAERIARLEQMSAEQKLELERKRERFEQLHAAERSRLRELHDSIESAANAAQLQQTLARYTAWLNTLSSAQRAELLSIESSDERIAKIKELMRQQELLRFRSFVEGDLPREDREAIYQWVGDYIAAHREEIEARMGNERWRLRDVKDEAARTRVLAFWLQFQMRDPQHKLPPEVTAELLPKLSETARQQLEKAQSADERQKRIEDLIRAAILSQAVPRASDDELRKFYAELPIEARSRLEGLEGEELKAELRRMYNFTRFQRGGPWGGWGSGRGPGGKGGPGGRREGEGRRGEAPRTDERQNGERQDGERPGGERRRPPPPPRGERESDQTPPDEARRSE